MKSKDLPITENKATRGADSFIVSLTLGNIILFKSDIEKLEKVIDMALRGGRCTYHNWTAEYNKRSKYVDLQGMGKYPLSKLQSLISKAKSVL